MQVKCKLVIKNDNNMYRLENVPAKQLLDYNISDRGIMSIDGSTTRTGVCIMSSDGRPKAILAVVRDAGETQVEYKVNLKKFIGELLLKHKVIDTVVYEEPFIEYSSAAKHLLMLRTFIEELIVENKPELDHVKYIEVNNKKWKRFFLHPSSCPSNSQLEKKMVRDKLLELFPYLAGISQDEVDATAIGVVATTKLNEGKFRELKTKRNVRPFAYNIEFIGADNDEEAFTEFGESYEDFGIPLNVVQNGLSFIELKGREDFDNVIYNGMGNEDKVLVLKFRSTAFGNVVLKHRIGGLANSYNWIYAVVWRKTRKR